MLQFYREFGSQDFISGHKSNTIHFYFQLNFLWLPYAPAFLLSLDNMGKTRG